MSNTQPGLFGLKHSSRDFTNAESWGKNIFNSTFPAALVAYMSYKNVSPIYLNVDSNNMLCHDYISGEQLYRVNPLSDNAYYNFEAGFSTFEKFYSGEREKIDLVLMDSKTNNNLIGLEVKLTALPDNSTKKYSEDRFGSEIVVRSPTICFLACGICELFRADNDKNFLRNILNRVPKINHWEEPNEVIPHYGAIECAIADLAKSMHDKQSPLIMQPVWKMKDGHLADDCLDVFVWSNLAVLHMCYTRGNYSTSVISRFQRALIWIYLMLKEYVDYGKFDYKRIVKNCSYGYDNDKAFAAGGRSTWPLMTCSELTHPRIKKNAIKEIILGGGQNLLKPERRFDAIIVNSPDLFD